MTHLIRAIAFVCLLVPLTTRAQNTLSITVSSDSSTTITTTIAASEVRVKQAFFGWGDSTSATSSAGVLPSSITVTQGTTVTRLDSVNNFASLPTFVLSM